MENTENNLPLVSVVILSFNRRNDLDYTLQRVLEQDYPSYEVIVVDNNSADGSAEMVKKKYPVVTLLCLPENIGIAGWNEGAKIAKGEYLLFLDDDSYPERDTLTKVHNSLSDKVILALDIRHPNGDHYSTLHSLIYPTFIGCGVIIPNKIFVALNGFEPLLFLYAHEEEFSMRALQFGYTIQYAQGMVVYHSRSRNNRGAQSNNTVDTRLIYFKNRNSIILLLWHFPLSTALIRICRMCAGRILFSIFHNCFILVVRSIFYGFVVSINNWDKRIILYEDIQRKYGYGKGLGSFFSGGDVGFKRPRWI